jgi:cysteine desulfurase/selenocysteine lyase
MLSDAPKLFEERVKPLRTEFPGVERWAYFDVAARGLLPRRSRKAVDAYLDSLMNDGGDKAAMFEMVESARRGFAQLIGAESHEIAITKNVSEGINIIATAFPWKRGDKVVLCAEREHPNNVYIWMHLAKRHGIEITLVESRNGYIHAEDVIDALDAQTRMVTVSSVSFHPGLRIDLDAVASACTSCGVFLLVDAVQSAGIQHIDVARTSIDAMAVSTQKGLLGLYGMGFLYCRNHWAEQLEPTYLARFGVDLGDAHEAAVDASSYRLMRGAHRFDLGNYNFAGATAVDASLQMLLEIGTEAIEPHVVSVTKRLAEGLAECGLLVAGWPYGPHFANMVTIEPRDDDPDFNAKLSEALVGDGVKFAIRRNALRFSSHFYNTHEEADRVIDAVRRFLRINATRRTGASLS